MSSSTQTQSNNIDDAFGTPPVEKKQPLNPTSSASEPDANTDGNTTADGFDDYPEQKHAGAVGYGPNFGNRVGFAEKIQGIKEQAKGKIVGNSDLVEQGHLRQTGELKRREEEKDEDPFATPEEK